MYKHPAKSLFIPTHKPTRSYQVDTMYQATIDLHQQEECILSKAAEQFGKFEMQIEDLHEHKVTCILRPDNNVNEYFEYLNQADRVEDLERLDEDAILLTKPSCGAYGAVYGNNCILQRNSTVGASNRRYHILAFQREDLRAMIKDFRDIGTITLDSLTEYGKQRDVLTNRQREVVETALEEGYFKWPREIDSEELADRIGIDRTTCLEHLRKAENRLINRSLSQGAKKAGF